MLAFAEVLRAVGAGAAADRRHPRRHPARLAAAALRAGGAPPRRLRRRAAAHPPRSVRQPRSTPTCAPSTPGLAMGRLRVAPKARRLHARRDRRACPRRPPTSIRPPASSPRARATCCRTCSCWRARSASPTSSSVPDAYAKLKPHDGQQVFFIVTPGGRVILKEAAAMTATDRAVYEEYTRNQARAADGSLGGGGPRLHIDRAKVDLSKTMPIDLNEVRRKDSGASAAPRRPTSASSSTSFPITSRAASWCRSAPTTSTIRTPRSPCPTSCARPNLATPGEPLPDFVERTYKQFFDVMIPAKTSEKELAAWIMPRLEIIRHSIRQAPLSPELEAGDPHRARRGRAADRRATRRVGCFVRSDTNVEDLDNFNGAGLNLTVFNRKSLDDIYEGLKEVWASPFAVPLVLLAPDADRRSAVGAVLGRHPRVGAERQVGRAGDGRSQLGRAGPDAGGDVGRRRRRGRRDLGRDAAVVAAGRRADHAVQVAVAEPAPARRRQRHRPGVRQRHGAGARTSCRQIIAAGQKITETFAPVKDPAGKPRPWDIEFGFAAGKLWLFQCRPFLGNDQLKNIPALAPLEGHDQREGQTTCSRSRRRSDDTRSHDSGGLMAVAARRLLLAASACWRGLPAPTTAFAALAGDREDLGRQRAAAGHLLPLVRAVLLHRLRAAHAGSRAASHIELSRGNQVRFTLVLGDTELDAYLDDLAAAPQDLPGADRRQGHRADHQQEYERFVEKLDRAGVADAVGAAAPASGPTPIGRRASRS